MGSAGSMTSFASGFCLRRESTLIESFAMMASLRVIAHVGHSTGGFKPLYQKRGMPNVERKMGTVAGLAMLCPPNPVCG